MKYQQELIPVLPEDVEHPPQSRDAYSSEEMRLRNQKNFSEATLHYSRKIAMKNSLKKDRVSPQSLDLSELNDSDRAYETVTLTCEPEEDSTSSVSGDHKGEGLDDPNIVDAYLLQKQEETAQMYLQQALSFCDREKWSQAVEYCKQALTIDPNSVEADQLWNSMLQQRTKLVESQTVATVTSQNLSSSDRLELAINRYRYQAQLHPDSAVVQTNLGKLYHKNRQWQEAIACYQKAIAIDSNYALAHQYLAQAIKRINH